MAFRKFFEKLGTPPADQDRAALYDEITALGLRPIGALQGRVPQQVAGEIESVRVVPRAGADAVEATLTDGQSRVVAVFLGRRRVPGISPGRRLIIEGVPVASGGRALIYNPTYTLLTAR